MHCFVPPLNATEGASGLTGNELYADLVGGHMPVWAGVCAWHLQMGKASSPGEAPIVAMGRLWGDWNEIRMTLYILSALPRSGL